MSIRVWVVVIFAAAGVALWGCSDDDKAPIEIDSTPPTVSTTFPADGDSNIPTDVNILVGFSENMTVSSLNRSTIQILGVPTDTVFANLRTATLIPQYNLFHDSAYTAVVTTGVRDLAGNNLQASYFWTFTIEPDTTAPPAE